MFLFFHLISHSHLSHSSFTNCKLHTRMLRDADLWRVRCSPINSGITKLKRPGTRSNRLGPDLTNYFKYRPELVRVPVKTSTSQLCQLHVLSFSFVNTSKRPFLGSDLHCFCSISCMRILFYLNHYVFFY